jgi:hypothetical protein
MGFKKASDILDQLFALAGDQERYFFRLDNAGVDLPQGLQFDVALVDLSSRLYSIYLGCQTGRDLLRYLNNWIREKVDCFGISEFYFSVDDSEHVTAAKGGEHLKRQEAKQVNPYDPHVELKQSGMRVLLTDFRFGFGALPADYDRLLATPELRRKWFVFVGTLLACYTKRPTLNRVTSLTITGFRHCSCRSPLCEGSRSSRVLKTVYYSEKSSTEAVISTTFDATSGAPPMLHDECAVGSPAQRHQRFPNSHIDVYVQTVLPSIEIGEAEGQCFHLVRKLAEEGANNARRFLVCVNDTDAVAIGLMSVPKLYNPRSQEIQKTLWLDLTSAVDNRKYLNLVALWSALSTKLLTRAGVPRPLSASTSSTSSSTATALRPKHGLKHPIELVLWVATLTGNDYCAGLSKLGPSTLFKQFTDSFLAKVTRTLPAFMRFHRVTGDMIVDEAMAFDFVVDAYLSMGPVAAAVKELRIATAEVKSDAALERLRVHFEQKTAAALTAARAANKNEARALGAALAFPSAHMIRSTIRRACFSLYYFRNVHKKLAIDATATIDGVPLYGYTASGEFAERVALRDGLRPFVLVGAPDDRPMMQRSASARLMSTSTNSLSSVTSEQDSSSSASLKRKSDSGEDITDPADDRPKKHQSLPSTPRALGVRELSERYPRAFHGMPPSETGPELSWLNNRGGATFSERAPFKGEHGSFFPLVAHLQHLSLTKSN